MLKLLRYILLCFFLILICLLATLAQAWQELSSEHFFIYFDQEEKFAKEVLDKAEVYYREIALDLGYPRYSEFWTWGKRAKIYIYANHEAFLKATNQPNWSEGMADYAKKEIISYIQSKGFLESILPHEMAHLIFRDFVGFKGIIPLWIDEGVSQWSEKVKRKEMDALAKQLFAKDALISVDDMMKLDIRRLSEIDRVYIRPTRTKDGRAGILFLSTDNLVNTFYIQSVSLVGFLISKYGTDRFTHFCRELRDGKALEEALRSAYPSYIASLADLEFAWRKYLERDY